MAFSKYFSVAICLALSFPALNASAGVPSDDIECVAHAHQVTYYVRLSGSAAEREMTVTMSNGERASGRVTSYRRNTRFYLPTGPASGIKLGLDGDRASLCLGAGGTDCHACAPAPSVRGRYVQKVTCTARQTPQGPATVILYYDGATNWAGSGSANVFAVPEMVVESGGQEVAAGAAWSTPGLSDVFVLPVGPGATERYRFDLDVPSIVLPGSTTAHVCVRQVLTLTPPVAPLADIVETTCRYHVTAERWVDVVLYSRGGHMYLHFSQEGEFTDSAPPPTAGIAGPAIARDQGQWQVRDVIFSTRGATGEVCSAVHGCRECQTLAP